MRIIIFKVEKYAPRAESRTQYFADFIEALDWFIDWSADSQNEKVAFSVCKLVDDISYIELVARCLNHSKHIEIAILLDAKDRKRRARKLPILSEMTDETEKDPSDE